MIISIMKKGQKVRIKSSGKIGVIADSEFFHWGGRKHVRYEVKFDKQKDTVWYPKEELSTDLVERTTMIIKGENGTLNLVFTEDKDKGDCMRIIITGNPENLKEHKGTHLWLASVLLERLSSNS